MGHLHAHLGMIVYNWWIFHVNICCRVHVVVFAMPLPCLCHAFVFRTPGHWGVGGIKEVQRWRLLCEAPWHEWRKGLEGASHIGLQFSVCKTTVFWNKNIENNQAISWWLLIPVTFQVWRISTIKSSNCTAQGLVTVPFWVYWTSPYSSHYRPYT